MLTPHKQRLLELPIVLSEPAWLHCVYIRDFLFEELSDRLSAVMDASYRAILRAPRSEDVMHFSLSLFPASGERVVQTKMELCLYVEYLDDQTTLLRVLLKNEQPPSR